MDKNGECQSLKFKHIYEHMEDVLEDQSVEVVRKPATDNPFSTIVTVNTVKHFHAACAATSHV